MILPDDMPDPNTQSDAFSRFRRCERIKKYIGTKRGPGVRVVHQLSDDERLPPAG